MKLASIIFFRLNMSLLLVYGLNIYPLFLDIIVKAFNPENAIDHIT
jgi:hypothetical protein